MFEVLQDCTIEGEPGSSGSLAGSSRSGQSSWKVPCSSGHARHYSILARREMEDRRDRLDTCICVPQHHDGLYGCL